MAATEGAGIPGVLDAEVRAAVARWAKMRWWAPATLSTQVTGMTVSDEHLVRVVTTVSRRTLEARRIPAANRSVSTRGKPMAAESIDLFAFSVPELQARSEHIEDCLRCRGSGNTVCPHCTGSGMARCDRCGGSGSEWKHYKTAPARQIQCKGCRGRGTITCTVCNRSGRVTCQGCRGSGAEVVWWVYQEAVHAVTRLNTQSPILAAHPRLTEARSLSPDDLRDFTLIAMQDAQGPLVEVQLPPQDLLTVRQLTPDLNPRVERIVHQQYLRLCVRRIDVEYELCGQRAPLVLSGHSLDGASTPEALAPLNRRKWLVLATLVICVFALPALAESLVGRTAYFASARNTLKALGQIATVTAALALAGLLRAWRPGFRRWPLRRSELASMAVTALVIVAAPIVGVASRPQVSEARAALARNNLTEARRVIAALEETAPSAEVSGLHDETELRGAQQGTETQRIAAYDAIADRHGPRAGEAMSLALTLRRAAVRRSLDAHQPHTALSQLDRWRPRLRGDRESMLLEAEAWDQTRLACRDDLCRLRAGENANAAHPTPARLAVHASLRNAILTRIRGREVPAEVGARSAALRATIDLAIGLRTQSRDTTLHTEADTARTWAEAQQRTIALLGAPLAVVNDLLGLTPTGTTQWPSLPGVHVYVEGTNARSQGLYVVGPASGRDLFGHREGLEQLLSQAVGMPGMTLGPRPEGSGAVTETRWRMGSERVLARWDGSRLIELRIGSVHP